LVPSVVQLAEVAGYRPPVGFAFDELEVGDALGVAATECIVVSTRRNTADVGTPPQPPSAKFAAIQLYVQLSSILALSPSRCRW
jgi:hypothetical protein